MVSVRCMRPGLPGGKVITAKRVPLAGGGVPRMRAPRSSTCSPTGISAGAPSVIQIRVDWAPDAPPLWLMASLSMITLATLLLSWPVTTRRIGGYFGCSALIDVVFPVIDARGLRATAACSCHYGAREMAFCLLDREAGCGNLDRKPARERNHVDSTPACSCRACCSCRRHDLDRKLRPDARQAEGRDLAARLLGQLVPGIRPEGGLPQGGQSRCRILLHRRWRADPAGGQFWQRRRCHVEWSARHCRCLFQGCTDPRHLGTDDGRA